MKLKFNEYGWIKCFEMVNDGQGGHFIWRRFDTKAAALRDLLDEADLNEVDEYTAPKIEAARAAIARATGDQTTLA